MSASDARLHVVGAYESGYDTLSWFLAATTGIAGQNTREALIFRQSVPYFDQVSHWWKKSGNQTRDYDSRLED